MEQNLQAVKRCVAVIIKQFDFGKKELHAGSLKELKNVVRQNEGVIPEFVDVLFHHLSREDSDLRLGVVLLVDYFFQRSHKFRVELVDHLQDFLLYTIETDPLHYPLPKPASAANVLKQESLKLVRLWLEKFGPGYTKLKNAEHFLSASKYFDFAQSRAEMQVERQRAEEERLRREVETKKTIDKVRRRYERKREDIFRCLTESRTAFDLLLPDFTDEPSTPSTATSDHSGKELHGYSSARSVSVVLPKGITITENDDNRDLIIALRDLRKLLEKYHSNVTKWTKDLTKAGDTSALVRQLIDARKDLSAEISKFEDIKITSQKLFTSREVGAESSDEDDSDLEDVPEKEGLETHFEDMDDDVPDHILDRVAAMKDQPGPSGVRTSTSPAGTTRDTDPQVQPNIPSLPFGLDLKYWGQDVEPAELVRNQFDDHRFWHPVDEGQTYTEREEVYKTRMMTFVGTMPEIKRTCRARLPSGKLCPRMDREKCPLHGPIIDRDEEGFPVEEQPGIPSASEELKRLAERGEREESEFLRDVEAATGRKLGTTSKTKKVKTARTREQPVGAQARERLKTKLFDKRTLKRVSDTLQEMQRKRAERKFAHQFNYALTRR